LDTAYPAGVPVPIDATLDDLAPVASFFAGAPDTTI
jgi:hypothetical protein